MSDRNNSDKDYEATRPNRDNLEQQIPPWKRRFSVFISYSRRDYDWVKETTTNITARSNSYDIWWDDELRAGDDWWLMICDEIMACDFFLFVLSPDSLKSAFCKAELEFAHQTLEKPIIPLIPKGRTLGGKDWTVIEELKIKHIQQGQADEGIELVFYLEEIICAKKLELIVNGYQPRAVDDDNRPELPRMSYSDADYAIEEVIRKIYKKDYDRALELCKEVVKFDIESLRMEAEELIEDPMSYQEAKALIEDAEELLEEAKQYLLEIDIKSRYQGICDLIDSNDRGELEVAKRRWSKFTRKFPNFSEYGLESLQGHFEILALDKLTSKELPLFDDDDEPEE